MLRSLIVLSLSVPIFAAEPEPPLEVTVEIDGAAFDARVGETAEVKIDGKARAVKVSAKPTRRFATAGIEFRYPSGFTYQFDGETPGLKMYTIQGADTTVMVQRFEKTIDSEEGSDGVLEYLREAFADSLPEEKDAEIRLGGKAFPGRAITVEVAGERLSQQVFGLPGADVVLVLQTPLDEGGAEPDEAKAVRRLLDETFRFDDRTRAAQ